jgi:hypothetical protein
MLFSIHRKSIFDSFLTSVYYFKSQVSVRELLRLFKIYSWVKSIINKNMCNLDGEKAKLLFPKSAFVSAVFFSKTLNQNL